MSSVINDIGNNPECGVIANLEPGAHGLSKAESRVFESVAAGFSRKQVAALYCRNIKTIDTQLEAALSKLGVHSVGAAVALMCAEGKLTFDAVVRGSRHVLLLFFMVSSVGQLFTEDQQDVLRLPRVGSVRVVRTREIV